MNALLIRPIALGAIWLLILFLFCFLGVHIAQLAKFGWKFFSVKADEPAKAQAKEPTAPPEKKAPASQTQEPVYYIVERKKKRPKSNYGEPKPIRFQ